MRQFSNVSGFAHWRESMKFHTNNTHNTEEKLWKTQAERMKSAQKLCSVRKFNKQRLSSVKLFC